MGRKSIAEKSRRTSNGLWVVYLILLLLTCVVFARLVVIQFSAGDEEIFSQKSTRHVLEPKRGAILSDDGSPLAISVPVYTIALDCTVMKESYARMKDREKGSRLETAWMEKARLLSVGLERILGKKSASDYYEAIRSGRASGKQYLVLCKDIDHATYTALLDLPLLNESSFRGGKIVESRTYRLLPYGTLAKRAIGYVRKAEQGVTNTHVGLEGRFDYVLHGHDGEIWYRQVDGKKKVRDYRMPYKPAEDGLDLRTTINIDIQDIADEALRTQIENDEMIEAGCCMVMEVATGAIKAMVNLRRDTTNHRLVEGYNYAIGRLGEPGSVFKTVTLMTLMEDGYVKSMSDRIPSNHGQFMTFQADEHIKDYEREHPGEKTIPIIEGFKVSSNYMFQYLAWQAYKDNPKRYIDKLYTYKLGEKFDFDLDGMGQPQILNPDNKGWGLTSLPSVAFGYSTQETPLHILTFYNALANKGRMMKPYLVESIEKNGKTVEYRGPGILNAAICSPATADTLKRGLKSVVNEGTAKRLKGAEVEVCGKTGTSRALIDGLGTFEDNLGRKKNQGTFVGYFPADDPQYSVIAVVYSKLSRQNAYGGIYPAGAVRYIVDEMFHRGMIKTGQQ